MSPPSPIKTKASSFTHFVVDLYDPQPEVIHQALQKKVEQAPVLFKNAPIVINVAALPDGANWNKIQQAITSAGFRIIGVSGCSNVAYEQAITSAGLPLFNSKYQKQVLEPFCAPSKAHIVTAPVRSGQEIYARGCDLIVTNNVNNGAELIADGNIHIYGKMQGSARVGASGDSRCRIFCTNLQTELVSIAEHRWGEEPLSPNCFGQAVQISLLDNALTIQLLNKSSF